MTSKLVVNTIEADTGISSVSFASSISMSSTSKFHFGDAGIDIGADTNINRPTAGALGFNINSSEKVRITSAGNVGIGTAVPESASNYANLSLADTTGGQIELKRLSDDTKHYIWGNQNLNIAGGYANGASSSIRFYVNGANERLRIDSSGRVMIGTTNEGEANADDLTIATTGHTGITLRSGTSNYGQIFFSDAESGTGEYEGIIAYDHSNNSMVFHTTRAERLRITSAGQLVMGATTSKAKFEIKDNGYTSTSALQRISADDDSPYALIIANDTLNTGTVSGLQFYVGNTGTHMIRARGSSTASNNNLQLVAQNDVILNSGSSESERIRLESGGNVVLKRGGISATPSLEIYGSGNTSNSVDSLRFHNWGDSDGDYWRLSVNAGLNSSGNDAKLDNSKKGAGITIDGRYGRIFLKTSPSSSSTVHDSLIVDSNGRVTKPLQPSFKAWKSGGTLTINANTIIVYNNTSSNGAHNTGTHYNTSNGRFTAPIAGKYVFYMMHIVEGSYSNNAHHILVNGGIYSAQHFTQSGSWHGITHVAHLSLNANDYVETRFSQNTTYYGSNWNHFSGYLVQ